MNQTDLLKRDFFWITKSIAVGPFASPKRAIGLRAEGITHVLNVGEAPNVLDAKLDGFSEVARHSILDLTLIPEKDVIQVIDTLHRMVITPNSKVYLHCIAGQNRSPTICWLYLIACGISPEVAKQGIEERMIDAIAGHPSLYTQDLLHVVKSHGEKSFQPHLRSEALEFV